MNVPAACIATAAGSVLALAAWQAKKHPRVLDRVPVAALIGMYGFFISALWIGLIAEELVGIIHVFVPSRPGLRPAPAAAPARPPVPEGLKQ